MVTDRVIPADLKDKIRILVVEDNLLNQKLAGFMLSDWGFAHDICSNGSQALDMLKQHSYDLVLMDIQMPVMNGYEATVYIRNEMKLGMPVIATTSHSSSDERARCLTAGMTDYITKPIKEVELFNLVTNYLFTTVVENLENRVAGQH